MKYQGFEAGDRVEIVADRFPVCQRDGTFARGGNGGFAGATGSVVSTAAEPYDYMVEPDDDHLATAAWLDRDLRRLEDEDDPEPTESQIVAATEAMLIHTNATGSVCDLSEQAERIVTAALRAA